MAAKKDPQPPADTDATVAEQIAAELSPDATAAPSEWDELDAPVAMASKRTMGDIKVNVLESVHAAIRERAENSLAVNAKAVAAKPAVDGKRPRVDYLWAVQPLASKEQGVRFGKAIEKYAKYRPATGDIPFKDDASPMGQVTCRTGVVTHYRLDESGTPTACSESDEGAYLGLRYSVRPLEVRNTTNRLPGTA